MREYLGVWNSFTTVRNLTNLIIRTDRRVLAVIVWYQPSTLSDKDYLPSATVHIYMVARGGAVGWGTALRVRFPMTSLQFYKSSILQAVLRPVVD